MKRSDFHYDLPADLIAQEPRERGRARMMIVRPAEAGAPFIEHSTFASFPEQLDASDVLVINDTRVIPARLYAQHRRIEFLLTRQLDERTWE